MRFKSLRWLAESGTLSGQFEKVWGRFWPLVEPNGDCWEWQGSQQDGYGRFYVHKRGHFMAHRVAYVLLVGPMPDDMPLDHLCRNHACVNPDHVEIVTQRENTLRGATIPADHARRTHCPKGHPYDDTNTLREKNGQRRCRECSRLRRSTPEARRQHLEYSRRHKARQRATVAA